METIPDWLAWLTLGASAGTVTGTLLGTLLRKTKAYQWLTKPPYRSLDWYNLDELCKPRGPLDRETALEVERLKEENEELQQDLDQCRRRLGGFFRK